MLAAAQADPRRFLDLYECFFHRVYAYVARRAPNRQDAEDITADVFQKALANIGKLEPRGKPLIAWFLTIAAHTLTDRWRGAAREAGANRPASDAPVEPDPDRSMALAQVVERLPAAQRDVIEMRFIEEQSIREIARALGKTEGAVKQLQLRALENLRKAWEASRD